MNALKYFVVFPLLIFSCAPLPRLAAPADKTDCSGYGNSPFPIWSHLTGVEISTLENADSARAGNPDALLALAIFASGNTRDSGTYRQYIRQVRKFIDSVRPAIDRLKDEKEKGRLLYTDICNTFYGTGFWSNELSGYEIDQSRLTEMLKTRKYNCISSSLLCGIIFRYFNLNVQGVVLPSHVFLQQNIPGDVIIEIETTTKNGFDFRHDARYFTGESKVWARNRGLAPITLEAYRHRQIFSLFELVCFNMINQHTDSLRMALCDRCRLFETAGFLWPEKPVLQSNRISILVNFYNRYNGIGDNNNALKFFEKVGPGISSLLESQQSDLSILNMLSVFEMQYAVTLAKGGRYAEARVKADAIIVHTDSSFKNRDLFINNACYIYGKYVETLMRQTKFPEARKLLAECPAQLRGTRQMNENFKYLFCAAGDFHYKEEKYRDAIALYISALPFCDKPSSIATWNNIQSAFLNLSRQYLLQNNRDAAGQTLKECMEKVPDCSKCKERLSTMH